MGILYPQILISKVATYKNLLFQFASICDTKYVSEGWRLDHFLPLRKVPLSDG